MHSGPELSRPAKACFSGSLNPMLALGPAAWAEARATVARLVGPGEGALRDDPGLVSRCVVPLSELTTELPVMCGDFVDMFAGKNHASNCYSVKSGGMSGEGLLPRNFGLFPRGYSSRASSLLPSGVSFRRPRGLLQRPKEDPAILPTEALDYEMELGVIVGGPANEAGVPVDIGSARARAFGLALLIDWSARDIQTMESTPLGPHYSKSFATSLGRWVTPLANLEAHRCGMPAGSDSGLPAHLRHPGGPSTALHYDLALSLQLAAGQEGGEALIATVKTRHALDWSFEQLVAQEAANGAVLRPGDIIGTGTLSARRLPAGPFGLGRRRLAATSLAHRLEFGCLLEATYSGTCPLVLPVVEGEPRPSRSIVRSFLLDGDRLTYKGVAGSDPSSRVCLGECVAGVLPASGQVD